MFGRGYIGSGFGCFGGYYSLLMLVAGIAITIIVAVLIYKLIKTNNGDDDALELLKLKFVKGEISEEEYISKKNALKK